MITRQLLFWLFVLCWHVCARNDTVHQKNFMYDLNAALSIYDEDDRSSCHSRNLHDLLQSSHWMCSSLITARLNLTGSFEDQITQILRHVRYTRGDIKKLQGLFLDIEIMLSNIWPGCRIVPYGSMISGLGLKTSDADCFVKLPPRFHSVKLNYAITASEIFKKEPKMFPEVLAVPNASVPIVKVYHATSEYHCDISFYNVKEAHQGLMDSKLVAYLIQLDRRFLRLALVIKYWSKVHGLTGRKKITNIAITTMLVFYMQQINILPSISQIQNTKDVRARVNVNNNDTVYQLLGGFFKYYSNFDFNKNIIRPFTGKVSTKDKLKIMMTVPLEVTERMHGCSRLELIESNIVIQEFYEHRKYCGYNVEINIANRIKKHIAFAASVFEENADYNYLTTILKKLPENTNCALQKENHEINSITEI